MSKETHTAIMDKTEDPMADIRYIGFGEPLMHPEIVDFVKEAAQGYGRLTHINTNASKLTPELAKDLVEAGLCSIKFSFQGFNRATYAMMRQIDFFDGMINAIKMMQVARGNLVYPFIAASTTTTDETPEQIEQFKERLSPLVDHLGIGKTIFSFIDMAAVPPKQRERLERAAATSTVIKKHPSPCPETNDKISVHWNGDVVVCCNDYSGKTNLGNVKHNSMASIWRHPTMEEYRKRLANNEYSGPLCSVCYDYLGLTEGII